MILRGEKLNFFALKNVGKSIMEYRGMENTKLLLVLLGLSKS